MPRSEFFGALTGMELAESMLKRLTLNRCRIAWAYPMRRRTSGTSEQPVES